MLAEMETKVLNLIYSGANCRLTVIPVRWVNGRAILNTEYRRIGVVIVCAILLLETIISINKMSTLAENGHISFAVLQSMLVVRYSCHLLQVTNPWIYKTEFVRLINQSWNIETSWGN